MVYIETYIKSPLEDSMKFRLSVNFKIIILVIVIVNSVLILVIVMIVNQIYQLEINRTEESAMDLAQSIARIPTISENIEKEDGINVIQPLVEGIRKNTQADFIVILDMEGIRYSHPVEDRLGQYFVGGDEKRVLVRGESYVSEAVGTLGESKRAFVPIYKENKQVGAVALGILVKGIKERIDSILSSTYIVLLWGNLLGVVGSVLLGNNVKKSIFGLEPREIAMILEEKNAIIDSLKEGVIAIDKDRKITLINREAKKLLNYGEEIMGMDINQIIKNTRLPILLQTGEAEYSREQIINDTVVLVNRIPIKVEDEVVGVVASFNKKNEVQRLAEELTGVKKFVEALRSQNHEFMNRLHTISGLIQLKEYDKAMSLISKVSSEKQEITSFIIDRIKVNEIAGLILGKFDRANELKIDFKIDSNSSLCRSYSLEFKNSLVTIIGNLIDNAIESLNDVDIKEKKIYIGLFEEENDLRIVVKDTGVGIPDSLKTKIFERGFSTKVGNSRGIGLDLIKSNINLFEGNIELKSKVNQGAEFIVTTPYQN